MYKILFDGVCNLCNASINFIIDRDKNSKFIFAALQSEAGNQLLKQHQISVPAKGFDSIILIKGDKVYKKSDAALEIAKDLSGFWSLFYVFKIIPSFIRDIFYNLIAKNRYVLFGKSDSCRIPTPELKQKFL
jgi:predicted DCC family thiol-disulfide oxidoreductase YuxK